MQLAKRKRLEEIRAHLRSLERQGLVVSHLCSDGQVRWYITEKGRREPEAGTTVRRKNAQRHSMPPLSHTRPRKRCRLHGGLSPGAPRGPKNGNFKTGDWTAEAIEERKWLRSLVQSFAKTTRGQ